MVAWSHHYWETYVLGGSQNRSLLLVRRARTRPTAQSSSSSDDEKTASRACSLRSRPGLAKRATTTTSATSGGASQPARSTSTPCSASPTSSPRRYARSGYVAPTAPATTADDPAAAAEDRAPAAVKSGLVRMATEGPHGHPGLARTSRPSPHAPPEAGSPTCGTRRNAEIRTNSAGRGRNQVPGQNPRCPRRRRQLTHRPRSH